MYHENFMDVSVLALRKSELQKKLKKLFVKE